MPSFYKTPKKLFILIILSFSFVIPSTTSILSNNEENIINKYSSSSKDCFNKEENYNFFRRLSYSCASTSYSKSQVHMIVYYNIIHFQITFQVIVIIAMV